MPKRKLTSIRKVPIANAINGRRKSDDSNFCLFIFFYTLSLLLMIF